MGWGGSCDAGLERRVGAALRARVASGAAPGASNMRMVLRRPGALRCFPGVARLCTTAERLVAAHEARGGQQSLAALSPQELASTAWAHAKAKRSTPALFDAIAVAATSLVDECKPRQLATTAWAFAKARRAAPPMLDAIAAAAVPRIAAGAFNAQDLSNTAWAYATLAHAAPALLDAIAAAAAQRSSELSRQHLCNLLWAYAVADTRDEALVVALSARVVRVAVAAAADLEQSAFEASGGRGGAGDGGGAGGEGGGGSTAGFSRRELAQLHQAQLWLEHEWRRPDLLLPPPLRAQCRAAMALSSADLAAADLTSADLASADLASADVGGTAPPPPLSRRARHVHADIVAHRAHHAQASSAQAQVALALSSLHVAYTPELIIEEGYSVDLCLPAQRVAIEVDGPSHFLAADHAAAQAGAEAAGGGGGRGEGGGGGEGGGAMGGAWVPTGATLLKRRQLRALGWRVLPIPLNEWPRGPRARQSYLAGQLARVCLEKVWDARAG